MPFASYRPRSVLEPKRAAPAQPPSDPSLPGEVATPGNDLPEHDDSAPSLSGQGLNQLAHDADANHRLLNLVPTPTWEIAYHSRKSGWRAGYALSPATEVWAKPVRGADPSQPSRVVGVVGATAVGKSWLVGKLLEANAVKPSRLEEHFDGVTLQSMTSDINLYQDYANMVYYIDFEGTYGTQPLQLNHSQHQEFLERCPDPAAWEESRRGMLKDFFQPAIAYLTCNVVIFMTREKLVCRRSLEECEHFAQAANGRVLSALPPALILIQNCCRPSEGIFKNPQCTEAFMRTHMGSDLRGWQNYFRSIDCFCIPDEYIMCKRSGFDGEQVCEQVLASLKETIAARLDEDVAIRVQHQAKLSQVQWFSVLSALCRIVNDRDTVQMSQIYVRTTGSSDGLGELKSGLLQMMTKATSVKCRVASSVALIARYAIRRELDNEEIKRAVNYLMALFPCGAVAPEGVERFDGTGEPVCCGQMRLFHGNLHRSSTLVRTIDADWLQGLGEWFRGGVTHAWPGCFVCHPDYVEYDDFDRVWQLVQREVEAYKLEKCLEGLTENVGAPWVLRAHKSFNGCGLRVRKDTSRMCTVCTAKPVDQNFWTQFMLMHLEGGHMSACDHCYTFMEKHDLCNLDAPIEDDDGEPAWDAQCAACLQLDAWPPFRKADPANACIADHRAFPCKCALCSSCAAAAVTEGMWPSCPLCGMRVLRIVDERALLRTGWAAAVERRGSKGSILLKRNCGVPCAARA